MSRIVTHSVFLMSRIVTCTVVLMSRIVTYYTNMLLFSGWVDSCGLYRYKHGHLVPRTCQHMFGAFSVSYTLVQGYQVPRTLLLGGTTCRSSQDHLYWELLGRPHSTLGVSSGGRTAGPAGQTLLPEGSDCCCCHPAKPRQVRTIAPRLTQTQTQHRMNLL